MALLPIEQQIMNLNGMLQKQSQPQELSKMDMLGAVLQNFALGQNQGLSFGNSLGLGAAGMMNQARQHELMNRKASRENINDQLNMAKFQAQLEQQKRAEALQREQLGISYGNLALEREKFNEAKGAKQSQLQAMQQVIGSLPPEQQAIAMANPDEFIKNMIKGGKEPTDGQNIAAGFADRMKASGRILNDLDGVGSSMWQNILGATNLTASPEFQRVEQAQRDWINAQLRRESGAAIAESEFENARRQYFPVVGDSKEVIEQKRKNREIAEKAMIRSAGRAYAGGGMLGNVSDPLGLR